MKRLSRIASCVGVLAACALGSCGDSTTGPRSDAPLTVISNTVYVVGPGDSLTLVSDADSILMFDMAGEPPKIKPDAIIVGTEADGYIRRVKYARVEGRRLLVHVSPAFLPEAIECGEIDTTLSLGCGLNLSGITLYSAERPGGGTLTVTITQGRIEFNPALDLFMRLSLGTLSSFRAVAEGDLRLTCDVKVEASEALLEAVDFETPLASVRRTVIQHVGPVPVVEVVTLSFVAGFSVSSGYAGATAMGMETEGAIQCGMRYDDRGWSSMLSPPRGLAAHPFQNDGEEQAEIRFFVAPVVSVDIYDLPCIQLELEPSLGFSERDVGFPVLAWEYWGDVSGSMALRRGAFAGSSEAYEDRETCCRIAFDSGPFRTDSYIFVTEWGNAGTGGEADLSYPKGIAIGPDGGVYVTDNWDNCVRKYASDGAFLLRWGEKGSGDGQFDSPEKIAIDEDGAVYVVDSGNNRVQKFTPAGGFIAKWGSEGTGESQFRSPVGVAASGGAVYVTDGQNHRVQKFSTGGDYLGAWGTYGTAAGQFDSPAGAAVISGVGDVLVADCLNSRIQRFSPEGEHIASWGSYGSADDQFNCSVDVEAAAGGSIFAIDLGNDRFIRFTPDGAFSTKLGTSGNAPGEFDHPEAIAVDGDGNVYVVDSRNRRVEKFAPRALAR